MPAGGGPSRNPHGEGPARLLVTGVLAYLFWHTPRSADVATYERGLAAFHRALAGARPRLRAVVDAAGRPAGVAARRPRPLPRLVPGRGLRRPRRAQRRRHHRNAPRARHDDVAALARTGTAALVAHVAGRTGVPDTPAVLLALVDKPAGQPYSTFRTDLTEVAATRPGTACWMRQMTLGPGPEFAVLADRERMPPLPAPVTILDAAVVATA